METTPTAVTAEQADIMINHLQTLNNFVGAFIVLVGILISFYIVHFLWKSIIKPILRDYIKLPL